MCVDTSPPPFRSRHLSLGALYQGSLSFDRLLESLLLWVQSVIQMAGCHTESDLGIFESGADFLINLVVLSLRKTVVLVLDSELEV